MAWRISRRIVVVTTALGAVVISLLVWLLTAQPRPEPMPNPNGYDELVKAGQELQQINLTNSAFSEWQHALNPVEAKPNMVPPTALQMRAALITVQPAIQLARHGMAEQCRVPYYTLKDFSNHLAGAMGMKLLAQAFELEGQEAEHRGRYSDAVRSYLDVIRLGQDCARGGTFSEGTAERNIEIKGLARVKILTLRLDARTCRETAAALQEIEAQREPADSFVRRERDFQHSGGIKATISRLIHSRTLRQNEMTFRAMWQGATSSTQLAIIHLANRAYQLDHGGTQPPNLGALVPQYLKTAPVFPDAVTNQ